MVEKYLAWMLGYLQAQASRPDMLLLMWFSSELTKKLNNVSISLPEWAEHWALRKVPACYRLITGEDDMWRCSHLGIVSLFFLPMTARPSVTPYGIQKERQR